MPASNGPQNSCLNSSADNYAGLRHQLSRPATAMMLWHCLSKLTVEKAKAYSSVAAIDIALRTVNNPMFTELCSQKHPGLRAVRNQERSALRLLQIHVRNRASHARTSSEEATHAGEADENNEMGEHTEQGKQKVWTDADGHVLHRMQVNADCTWDPLYDKYEQNRLKRMSRRGAYRYAIKTKGQPPMNLDNKEAFINWMTEHSTDHSIITPLYDRFDRATCNGSLAKRVRIRCTDANSLNLWPIRYTLPFP